MLMSHAQFEALFAGLAWRRVLTQAHQKRWTDGGRMTHAAVSAGITHDCLIETGHIKYLDLLGETATLKAILIVSKARNLRKEKRIEWLATLVAAFKHAAFGRRLDPAAVRGGA